ncbi:MAG: acetylglutamate kinase [Candidatus Omnitrophota bacterium]
MEEVIKKADVLIEALPYIKAFHKKILVIKYGGSILADTRIRKGVLEDIVFLNFMGLRPTLVHGGGPSITERVKQEGKKTEFVDGIRVTDKQTLKIVKEELEKINKQIVSELNELGAKAVGLKGSDKKIITVKRKFSKHGKSLGFVGKILSVNSKPLLKILEEDSIPVIYPFGLDEEAKEYNVNADEVAAHIAVALKAEKIVLLTDVNGIMRNQDDINSFLPTLTINEAKQLEEEGVIQEGMIPKVSSAIEAITGGAHKAHIINAKLNRALLLEIFTDQGIGTEIIK